MIDIDSLRVALRASEARVRTAVAAEFSTLHDSFGVTPNLVVVEVFDVTPMGATERQHVVGSVKMSVTL